MIAGAEAYRPERDASMFSADIATKIDKPGSKDRAHGIIIYKGPQGLSTKQYEQKFESILDRIVALPVTQKNVLKLTVVRWLLVHGTVQPDHPKFT